MKTRNRKEGRKEGREPEQEKEKIKGGHGCLDTIAVPPVGLYDHTRVLFVH